MPWIIWIKRIIYVYKSNFQGFVFISTQSILAGMKIIEYIYMLSI